MAHSLKGVGSFAIVALLVYFVVKHWANIKAAVASGVPGAHGSGGILAALGFAPANASPGSPGYPAFSSAFGGSGSSFSPNVNLFQGRLQAETGQGSGVGPGSYQNRPGGFGGGAIEEGNSQGGGDRGPVPNGFGNCSVNPRDGKLVCV